MFPLRIVFWNKSKNSAHSTILMSFLMFEFLFSQNVVLLVSCSLKVTEENKTRLVPFHFITQDRRLNPMGVVESIDDPQAKRNMSLNQGCGHQLQTTTPYLKRQVKYLNRGIP
ncbi:hypothetical protein AVEN_13378-1 [Araneus ventricosus]|uniref:Uncharacterized protein n=1 Tax=Araneus ventricosus TaxID=182803 RepID=A0A4Y2UFC0_ARAVE|nr:hypothetical protein AVEN_13378-1 [Araneus ventricosus]